MSSIWVGHIHIPYSSILKFFRHVCEEVQVAWQCHIFLHCVCEGSIWLDVTMSRCPLLCIWESSRRCVTLSFLFLCICECLTWRDNVTLSYAVKMKETMLLRVTLFLCYVWRNPWLGLAVSRFPSWRDSVTLSFAMKNKGAMLWRDNVTFCPKHIHCILRFCIQNISNCNKN